MATFTVLSNTAGPDQTAYVQLTVAFGDHEFTQLIVTGDDPDSLPLTLQQYADTYEADWVAAQPVE